MNNLNGIWLSLAKNTKLRNFLIKRNDTRNKEFLEDHHYMNDKNNLLAMF